MICIVVAFSGISIYLNIGKSTTFNDAMSLLTWLILIAIEAALLIHITRFYQKRLYPLPLLFALAVEPPATGRMRLAAAGFWLIHAVAGVLAFAWVDYFFSAINLGRRSSDYWFEYIVLRSSYPPAHMHP